MQHTAIFHSCKNDNFQLIFLTIFIFLLKKIDRGYTLEPPQRGGSNLWRVPTIYVLEQKYENNVYPCKSQFYYMKVGCKGVFITRTCLYDAVTMSKVAITSVKRKHTGFQLLKLD